MTAPGVCRIAALVAGILSGVPLLFGHHSLAMFDTSKLVTINGTVRSFEWTNPHAFIEMDVPGSKPQRWSVEMASPNILTQAGWTFRDLKAGDKVTVVVNPLRNGDPVGLMIEATLPDGRTLGSGLGRPPAKD